MEDSREVSGDATNVRLFACANFTSSLASGEAWAMLFSFVRNSSYCHVIIAMEARRSIASLRFLLKRLPPLKEFAKFFILAVIPQ